jgi:hypothetical protein
MPRGGLQGHPEIAPQIRHALKEVYAAASGG